MNTCYPASSKLSKISSTQRYLLVTVLWRFSNSFQLLLIVIFARFVCSRRLWLSVKESALHCLSSQALFVIFVLAGTTLLSSCQYTKPNAKMNLPGCLVSSGQTGRKNKQKFQLCRLGLPNAAYYALHWFPSRDLLHFPSDTVEFK